jgi:putative flavoprotein involved in K+ transport
MPVEQVPGGGQAGLVIDIPVLDARGEPLHRRGITEVPGLYFLGLQWLSKMKSSFLSGVGDDAADLADHIAARN